MNDAEHGGVFALTGSFTIPLDLTAPPEQVWRLFAELPLRRTWVRMPGPSSTVTHELDFRAGGEERLIEPARSALVDARSDSTRVGVLA